MNDVVNEAAQVLVPLLAAGTNAAVEEASKEAGKKFAGAVGKVLARIQKSLSPRPKHTEVAAALQSELDAGAITMADLKELVKLSKGRVGHTHVNVYGDNSKVLTDPTFNDTVIIE